MKDIILTADRPTGQLHIGHFVGSLRERVRLQNETDYEDLYVMVADVQALTDNSGNPQKIRDNILEVVLDYLAVGIDPNKSTICLQSAIPALAEITQYYMNLVTVSRLQRNPTVKQEIILRDFEKSIPAGFLAYPVSQSADITAFEATIVPVGEDQLPMLEQAREIVRSFNFNYGETLVEASAKLPSNEICRRLPGTDGNAKMGKSLGNCIYLADKPEVIKQKVMSMFTDPNHIRVEDPGDTKNNTVFIYLEAFATDEHFKKYLPEYKNLKELKAHYERGGLGDVKVKRFLNEVMQETLKPIREKREYYAQHIEEVIEILKKGTEKANKKANETLEKIKHAMGIDYFSNDDFKNEQIKKFNNK